MANHNHRLGSRAVVDHERVGDQFSDPAYWPPIGEETGGHDDPDTADVPHSPGVQSIPWRGMGASAFHGVEPSGERASNGEPAYQAKQQGTIELTYIDEGPEQPDPVPVYIVDRASGKKDPMPSFRTFRITLGDTPVVIVGRDPHRTNCIIALDSSANQTAVGTASLGEMSVTANNGYVLGSQVVSLTTKSQDAIYGVNFVPGTNAKLCVMVENEIPNAW